MAINVARRKFIAALGGAAAAWPLAAYAQQPAMPVIGWLDELPLPPQLGAAFRRGVAELGYVEGKNFASEYRFMPESLPQAASDLVRLNVNVIFAIAPAALAAVSNATTSIPVVGVDWRIGDHARCPKTLHTAFTRPRRCKCQKSP
jgi:putative tryptophan/tyrosine transport system substrate-binding protein